MIPTFDLSRLPPAAVSIRLAGASIESPRAVSGMTGAIDFSGGGFWVVKLSRIQMFSDPAVHRTWLALDAMLSGGVSKIVIPFPVDIAQPGAVAGEDGIVGPVPHSDGKFYLGGAGHTSPASLAVFGVSAASGDATVTLRHIHGAQPCQGASFGVYHRSYGWRAYRIVSVDSSVGDLHTVWIRPPLRASVAVGQSVDWYRPRCVMRIGASQPLGWEVSGFWKGTPDITFVEAMERV